MNSNPEQSGIPPTSNLSRPSGWEVLRGAGTQAPRARRRGCERGGISGDANACGTATVLGSSLSHTAHRHQGRAPPRLLVGWVEEGCLVGLSGVVRGENFEEQNGGAEKNSEEHPSRFQSAVAIPGVSDRYCPLRARPTGAEGTRGLRQPSSRGPAQARWFARREERRESTTTAEAALATASARRVARACGYGRAAAHHRWQGCFLRGQFLWQA